MQLTKKQNEYIRNANARWNLKIGAVRSGKSYVDIAFVILDRITALKDKQGLNVILGVSKETIERNVLQPMREIYTSEIVGEIDSRNKVKIAGIPVYCLGAEKKSQIAKILGSSIKYCYGDEIAKWSKGVFDILKSRLDKPYSCFDGSCNPEYPSHWLKEFIDNPNINSYVQKYTLFDNPTLSQEFVENLCTEYEGTVFYKRLVLGEWAIAEGLIYPHYEKALKEPPKDENGNIKKAERYVLSIDYGTMNAFACLLWGKFGNVWYAIDGYYYSGREKGVTLTDEEYADEITKRFGDYGNIKTIIDPSAASMIACLRKRGYSIVKADNDVMNGIQETGTAIHKDRIKINPAIKEWKQEAAGYAWDETADDRPIKVNDHCLTGDTLVMTENGEKPISELVGTSGNVWSYNTETNTAELKHYHDCRLTQKQAEIYEIETTDGRFIHCTSEHPILTERGYVLAKGLYESDKIVDITDSMSYNVDKGGLHYDSVL